MTSRISQVIKMVLALVLFKLSIEKAIISEALVSNSHCNFIDSGIENQDNYLDLRCTTKSAQSGYSTAME
jgi:hypothetical protein